MDDLELLVRVREKLARPEAWTTTWYARTAEGIETDPDSKSATCWCLAGAAVAITKDYGDADRLAAALGFRNHNDMAYWQDSGPTHAKVLARLDAAIKERSHAG